MPYRAACLSKRWHLTGIASRVIVSTVNKQRTGDDMSNKARKAQKRKARKNAAKRSQIKRSEQKRIAHQYHWKNFLMSAPLSLRAEMLAGYLMSMRGE